MLFFADDCGNGAFTMTRKRSSTSRKTPIHQDELQLGLNLHTSSERLHALLRERERMVGEVRKKQLAFETARTKLQESAMKTWETLGPLMAQFEALSREVHRLFDELLAPNRKLSAAKRKKIKQIRLMLEEDEILAPLDEIDRVSGEKPDDDDEPFGAPQWPVDEPQEVSSASPRGQEAGHDSLRSLFKRLALLMHPDRATHEPDRERRTEVMKEVTKAYNDGDLARLVELEKSWGLNAATDSNIDVEARCVELERMITELRLQAKELDREKRRLRQDEKSTMFFGSMDGMVEAARAGVAELEALRDFVKNFRDGKMTLEQFLAGPTREIDAHEEAIERLMESLLRDLAAQGSPRPKRGNSRRASSTQAKKGKKKGAPIDTTDVPF